VATEPFEVATLSLGGNEGDVRAAFRFALRRLAATPGVEIVARSGVWRTPPWGKTDQADFLNMAATLRTRLSARGLLELCQDIEREGGRQRRERWGPRTLDIDIITFGEARIDEPDLVVPHPRAAERAFVLAPLAEIAPDARIGGARVADLLARLDLGGAQPLGPLPRD
jgi:2-amino-4-hydroxy-6-hydroxymethyldihydropteridine diphosphokinase